MNSVMEKRIKRLETARNPEVPKPYHIVFGGSHEETERMMADKIGSGDASENDNFIMISWLEPTDEPIGRET